MESQPFMYSSSNVVAEKVVRQGLYQDYEVDIVQEKDDARSTFKGAKETKSKKGKRNTWLNFLSERKIVLRYCILPWLCPYSFPPSFVNFHTRDAV